MPAVNGSHRSSNDVYAADAVSGRVSTSSSPHASHSPVESVGRAVAHHAPLVGRLGVGVVRSVPEGAQQRHPLGVVPHARRDRPSDPGRGAHRRDTGGRIVHEVDDELRQHDVERLLVRGQPLGCRDADIDARNAPAALVDERLGRIDRRNARHAQQLDERVCERARPAPHVERPLAGADSCRGDVCRREARPVAADEPVVRARGRTLEHPGSLGRHLVDCPTPPHRRLAA